MPITDHKITPEQIAEKGVVAAPDTLTGTAQENKGVFDRLTREIVAPAVNAALDELKEVEDNNEEWAKAEAERVENENERIANETERQENEQARIAAEEARETAEQERKTAEDQRGTAEQARQTAEAARAAAEVQRQANEQARDTAEKGRESAEGKREQAEQARALWETYDPQKAYVPGNKVSFGGSSYVNIKPSTGTAPTDGGHWLLIAAKGLDGQGSGDMTRAVYDPAGKAQDIFAYADKVQKKAIPISEKGAANGVAPLGDDCKVPEQYLPETGAPADGLPTNDVRTGTVRTGQNITAGDVVDVQNGEIFRNVTTQANTENTVENEIIDGICCIKLNDTYSIVAAISASRVRLCTIENTNGAKRYSTDIAQSNPQSVSLARLDDTHFVVQYVNSVGVYNKVGTVSGVSISLGSEFRAPASTLKLGENAVILALDDTRTFSVTAAQLYISVCKISGGSGTIQSNKATGTVNANYVAATKISDDEAGNKRVLICFQDRVDSKNKAIVATVDASNTITLGEAVELLSGDVRGNACIWNGSNICAVYYSNSVGYVSILEISGTTIHPLVLNQQFDTSVSSISVEAQDDRFILSYRQAGNTYARVLQHADAKVNFFEKFAFYKGSSYYTSTALIAADKILIAYQGSSNYGATTVLTILGDRIGGPFVNSSKDAIALESGNGGDTVKVGFGGYCACEGVTEGQAITSEGVTAYSPLDGWLKVTPWQEKEEPEIAPFVVGEYTGTGTYGSGNGTIIDVGFRPRFIIIKTNSDAGGNVSDAGWLMLTTPEHNGWISYSYYMAPGITALIRVHCNIGTRFQIISYDKAEYQCNAKGLLYKYIAFR